MNITSLAYEARAIADRSKRYSQRHFKLIGAIAFFTLPLSTSIESIVGDPAFNTIYIRTLAGCLGIPFLFYDRLPEICQRNLDLIWISSVTLVLPFSFGLILTMNAVLSPPQTSPSPIWVYQYIAALFIFIQLINHGPMAGVLWLIATIGVFLVSLGVPSPNVEAVQEVWLYPMPVYLTALVVGSITNRNVHVVQEEQLRAAAALGSNIAHELRTPLASIRIIAHALNRFLPDLVIGYRKAADGASAARRISARQLDQLEAGLESIQAEVAYSNTIIDMLLANTSATPASVETFEVFPMSDVVQEAISRFPFNNSTERTLIYVRICEDFTVFAPKPLVIHVLFNLIKNGLYFLQRGGAGGRLTITLSMGTTSSDGLVEVTDTGVGIPQNLQSHVFDRFYSSDRGSQGAGIGLSFCKMVMESLGGDVRLDSKEGEYTTFRLIFPDAKPVMQPEGVSYRAP